MSQLRQKDVTDPDEVEYAILEPNGQISIVKKSGEQSVTLKELGLKATERGMMHLVVCDGQVNSRNLSLAGKDEAWLDQFLITRKICRNDVFLLLVNDNGDVRLYPKEKAAS